MKCNFRTHHSPQIAFIGRIFDVIANGLEHAAGRGHIATVEHLEKRKHN